MDILETHVDRTSEEFRANHARMSALVAELREHLATARLGGGPRYLQRHRDQGKLPARDRIERLLDPQTPFRSYRYQLQGFSWLRQGIASAVC